MDQSLNLQTIMMNLQRYWAEQGCLIWQPYYSQVGAGTMNPATFLRVLGPEPWNVAYVEPSVRPDDGRYGENPYRFQQHYQYQVILKPDPGNPQELYLNSLKALGIDPRKHDIRFVEDNWESPALGAWGLGWEVWLDGQEITQFTYFQQAGGIVLDPVSVEITYGLERLAMPLLNQYHFKDLKWNSTFTDGDVNYQAEKEHSQYYYEIADIDRLRQMYALFEKEANLAIEQELVLPAYDYILKCSHTFNILDTRGAIGVTERQALFSGMRDLSHRCAQAYLDQREKLKFPWLEKKLIIAGGLALKTTINIKPTQSEIATAEQSFLLEIGTEELPSNDLTIALKQLNTTLPSLLDNLHVDHSEVKIYGTPRRLVASIEKLSPRQNDSTQIIKGPSVSRGLDPNGHPTQAAEGFARSKGVSIKDLVFKNLEGGDYLVAEIHSKGKPTIEVLATELSGLIAGLHFEKSMRWNASNVAFSRPIRWLLALFGDQLVNFEYAGLPSGNTTRGLRFHTPEEVAVRNSQEYFEFLKNQGIEIDPVARRQQIEKQVKDLIKKESNNLSMDAELLEEVNNLVEAPTALLGSFDASYLALPGEVLVSVMKKHQRYFSLHTATDELLPHFITIRNGDNQYIDSVKFGNEQVIQARFADANFFISEDLKCKLEEYLPKLKTLTFHLKLGSMFDKTERIRIISKQLAVLLSMSELETRGIDRAAQLCKADLVTSMVIEMTALQGIMGRYYALKSGESALVAQAIEEHYYPRFSGDVSPKSKTALVLGLADRLDSLAGLFAVGMAPSGTKDPFALRRSAIGLVQNLIQWNINFDLNKGLDMAGEALRSIAPLTPEIKSQCLGFISGRLENYLLDQGYRHDVVAAVLAEQGHDPAQAYHSVQQLSDWVKRTDWATILPAFARCVRITRDIKDHFLFDTALFAEPAEKELAIAFNSALATIAASCSVDDLLNAFLPMIPTINHFFEAVMVMVEDKKIRENRLGLLQQISALSKGIADFSKLEGF